MVYYAELILKFVWCFSLFLHKKIEGGWDIPRNRFLYGGVFFTEKHVLLFQAVL